MSPADAQFMARALELGRRGLGRTRPNPPVGCVLVRDGEIIAEGWHQRAGTAHAEVDALRHLGGKAPGATAYVTLEPCNHTGRTGPCTEALLAAGVSRVVAGTVDPNPRVAGAGLARLREGGVEVSAGVREAECRRLIAGFAQWILTGRPQVILKVATSLDGRIATATGHSRWVTGPVAREQVHHLRDRCDAVMVGAGTVRADDPLLTTRLPEGGRNAQRVVLSASVELPTDARLWTGDPTLVLTGVESEAAERLRTRGVEVVAVGGDQRQVDLEAALHELGRRQLTTVLVEGGRGLATALLGARLADRLVCHVAPKVVGDDGLGWAGPLGIRTMDGSIRLEDLVVRPLGDDVSIEGDCVYGDH